MSSYISGFPSFFSGSSDELCLRTPNWIGNPFLQTYQSEFDMVLSIAHFADVFLDNRIDGLVAGPFQDQRFARLWRDSRKGIVANNLELEVFTPPICIGMPLILPPHGLRSSLDAMLGALWFTRPVKRLVSYSPVRLMGLPPNIRYVYYC